MQEKDQEVSLKSLFVPLTTLKAINIIIILGFIVFGNMLFNGFVWDDFGYIINNPLTHNFNIIETFSKNTFNNPAYYYRPISIIYFTLLYFFVGSSAFFYHFLQLILHITNVLLIFFFLRKLLDRKVSLLLSLIFLVHPLNVESVSFIAATVGALSFFLGMLALFIASKDQLLKRDYLVISLLLFCSLLAKETGILFVLIILLYKYFFNRKNIVRLLIFEFVTVSLYLFIRIFSIGISSSIHQNVPILQLNYFEKIINIPKIIFYYIKTFFYPSKLYINQFWTIKEININDFYLPLIFTIIFFFIIFSFGIYIKKNNKKLYKSFVFFFCWFIFGIVLLLPLFPLDMTVADRWFYFPMVGVLGMVGVYLQNLEKNKKVIPIILAIIIVCLSLLAVRTMVRNSNYYNNMTLFAHDSQIEDNYELELNLGNEFLLAGDTHGAIAHFEKSITMFPYEVNLYNLGYVYDKTNNIQKAKEYYSKALKYPHYSHTNHKHLEVTYYRLGLLLLLHGNSEEAHNLIEKALVDYPESDKLWVLLAIHEYKQHNIQKALYAADKAKSIAPNGQNNYIYLQILNGKPIEISTGDSEY